jgi:hypothetical protein
MSDLIYKRFSTLESHPVLIISMPLRAKNFIWHLSIWHVLSEAAVVFMVLVMIILYCDVQFDSSY